MEDGPPNPSLDLGSEEFRDYEGPVLPEGASFDPTRLLTANSLRGLAAVVVSVLVIRTPSQSPRGSAILLAAILLAWAVGGVAELRDPGNRSLYSIGRVTLLAAAGIGLLFAQEFTGELLGRILGYGLMVLGVVTVVRAFRDHGSDSRTERLLSAAFFLVLGGALVASPESILGLAILLVSIYWFLAGVMTLVTNLSLDGREIEPSSTWHMFLEWIQTRPNTADDRSQLYEKLFYEGRMGPRRLSRFFTLMGFATAIAAWGIIADSTAVVIGAMLVAPLMTPLMGTSLSMVMGWPKRALMSGGVALAGVLFAIGLSVLFGWMFGPEISPISNTQVASRIGPTLVDLIIAVAAGGAGAFALSRPDVSDSLPGVAVAIALVPPLAVVGLMLSQLNWGAATGALLLFGTNLVAILLVGGLVFVLTGVVPVLQLVRNVRWIRRTLGMVGILAIGIVAILGFNVETFNRQTAGLQQAEQMVDDWLGERDLEVVNADYSNNVYTIVLSGPDTPPSIEALAESVEEEFDQRVALEVRWVPTETFSFEP